MTEKTRAIDDSEIELLFKTIDEVNKELLKLDGLSIEIEKFKEDLVSFIKNFLRKYRLSLTIPVDSPIQNLPIEKIHLNENGISLNGPKESQLELKEVSPFDLIAILKLVMPHIRDSLRLKIKEYESLGETIKEIRKIL